ncbi:MgtC/SapB family protein [Bifidobacterium mongoliense]|uniref:MgtC/SapB family protein n=1 Tax=Bifidobacterium mongoliense TaxID=518643 RepID=UPI002A762B03|nr:MgtC/SapB family protein [Bifidobacterium mongoliense]MDY3125209.1 MgtC/SapB family protein [Bifidobacterium mongoliense]
MSGIPTFGIPTGQQLLSLTTTVLLCGLIGFEREFHDKDAGIRTNVLVGLGSWLFTVVSFYGYRAVAGLGVSWDASRVAAQVVSGIGFIGAGVIFIQRDNVRGVTTAAGIWVASAIGVAAAANMLAVSLVVTVMYFLVVLVIAPLTYRVTRRHRFETIRLVYENGKGSLRAALVEMARAGLTAQVFSSRNVDVDARTMVAVGVRVRGPVTTELLSSLIAISGMKDVETLPPNEE